MINQKFSTQITLHNSQPEIFETNFDEFQYTELFKEYCNLCIAHDQVDKFGLSLRHKHFDLQQGEVALRQILSDGIDLFPKVLEDVNDIYPYIFVLENDEVKVVEYVHSIDEDLSCNDSDYIFFQAVFDLLKKYKLENTLGIQRLVKLNKSELSSDQGWIESSHEEKERYETTRVRSLNNDAELISTLWITNVPLMACTLTTRCAKDLWGNHVYKENHK